MMAPKSTSGGPGTSFPGGSLAQSLPPLLLSVLPTSWSGEWRVCPCLPLGGLPAVEEVLTQDPKGLLEHLAPSWSSQPRFLQPSRSPVGRDSHCPLPDRETGAWRRNLSSAGPGPSPLQCHLCCLLLRPASCNHLRSCKKLLLVLSSQMKAPYTQVLSRLGRLLCIWCLFSGDQKNIGDGLFYKSHLAGGLCVFL